MKNLIREGGKILTLRHMKIFTTVYRCGSVTRAAQELHLAQPSLSVAIRELEEHYGVRLFERTGRAISPTQAAGALYGYASHIVSLFDDMEKQMRNWDTLGVLRLGASVTIGTHILPDLIRRYQARVPQLRIEALVEQSSGIERKLLDNEIDIGLIETQPEQPELLAIPFLRDELCAIVPLGSALAQKTSVTLRELSEYPFLMREPGSAVRQILDASFSLLQITVHPVWQSASTQAIVSAVAESDWASRFCRGCWSSATRKRRLCGCFRSTSRWFGN